MSRSENTLFEWWQRHHLQPEPQETDPEKLGQRTPPDERLFERLADLAGVPVEGTGILKQAVHRQLDDVWNSHWVDFLPDAPKGWRTTAQKELRNIERLSRGLHAALQKLSPRSEAAMNLGTIEVNDQRGPIRNTQRAERAVEFEWYYGVIERLAEIASQEVSRIARQKRRGKGKGRGRPRGSTLIVNPSSFPGTTLFLLWDVRAAGGRLTLDKNSGRGTLPQALQVLSPYLPPGFIPKSLTASTLAKLKAMANKMAKGNIRTAIIDPVTG